MLARQRQAFILDRVREDGAVRVADLVRELGVSDMTVRRDLEILDERGLLEKVHGGATAIPGSAIFEPGFAVKSSLQQAEKDAIADAAVGLAEPGMAVAVSAGHDDLCARPAPRQRARADGRDELDPGRRRPLSGRPARTRRSS